MEYCARAGDRLPGLQPDRRRTAQPEAARAPGAPADGGPARRDRPCAGARVGAGASPAVIAIPSARSVEHALDSVAAADLELSAEDLAAIDRVSSRGSAGSKGGGGVSSRAKRGRHGLSMALASLRVTSHRHPPHCHRTSVAPTVNPAPTATNTTRSPRFDPPPLSTSVERERQRRRRGVAVTRHHRRHPLVAAARAVPRWRRESAGWPGGEPPSRCRRA